MSGAAITVHGNLTADPELRHTQNGIPVATFNVAHTPSRLNRETGQWEDAGDPLFLRVNVWREQGENIAATLKKGAAVLIIGRLVARNWETKEGEKRTSVECEADIVSLDLRRMRAENVRRLSAGVGPDPVTGPAEDWSAAKSTAAA